MISVPNNVRFRFRDSDADAQIVMGKHDYDKMLKKFMRTMQVSRKIAMQYIHVSFVQEIVRVYGKPSNVTLVLDDTSIIIQ